ncbi:MAG: class I SAM-dependent methyltransferase [Deltaproteobacteria bacterium HGW-Deltaproteobacteria-24]|jgi:2-polyprenyl-3-methyl-5-hydroxy-6-metoxy-1,4-benzoquinol methylase|nr:MAG: class I SAM-dependent methyltransferase [Deltaproteobacteria bacterium HGW-Deltaproteobacteria-24]
MNRFDLAAKEWDTKPTSQLVAKATSEKIRENISLENKQILDYGCGTGLLAFSISDEARMVTGMDNSAGMVEVFNQKAQDFGFDNIKAVQHNIDNEELPQNAFDVIVTSMTLHHILNPNDFFIKCKKALKPNGYLCISDLDEEDGTFHEKHKNDGVHHFGFSKAQMAQFYTNNGYTLIYLDDICTLERENGNFPIFLSIGQI